MLIRIMGNSGIIVLGIGVAATALVIPRFFLNKENTTPSPTDSNNPQYVPPKNQYSDYTSQISPYNDYTSQISPIVEPELVVDYQVIAATKTVLPDIEGGQITGFIHDTNIENLFCGYRGTNFKCYDSEYDAWINGAVPNYDPHNKIATKP